MLSDLGGNLGLYVGASLFTFFEFTQLIFDTMVWFLGRDNPRKKKKKNEEETIQSNDEFLQVRL